MEVIRLLIPVTVSCFTVVRTSCWEAIPSYLDLAIWSNWMFIRCGAVDFDAKVPDKLSYRLNLDGAKFKCGEERLHPFIDTIVETTRGFGSSEGKFSTQQC